MMQNQVKRLRLQQNLIQDDLAKLLDSTSPPSRLMRSERSSTMAPGLTPSAFARRLTCLIAALGLALSLFLTSANADSKPHFAWKEPVPGTHAVLGADGGEATTVCDTAAKFKRWIDSTNDVAGCHALPAGLPIILGSISDTLLPLVPYGNSYPLIKIVIPSRHNYSGYVMLFNQIHPSIPKGTVVHYKARVYVPLRLAPSPDSDLNAGPDLGESVTATILRYDPTSNMELYVEIKDGKFAGQRGWMTSSDAIGEDGDSVDIFYDSVIAPPTSTRR